ncbi:MAG: TonB-dependent receptor plug domain-containing protein [Pseudomonadota bacterium]
MTARPAPRPSRSRHVLRGFATLAWLLPGAPLLAQNASPAPGPAPASPAAAAPKPAAAASAPAPASAPMPAPRPAQATAPASDAPSQRVEITGGRESDAEQRRQSTAARIVIGREEIDKFGDATIGEVLRRLPGVTPPAGPPGRGGPPRMRGLGGGYTQLLIDGQRVPPGFSLDQLTPEQVERIEILRAPTAETGARAIAGTINIVTREGFKRRLNDLRVGTGYENGGFTPGISWTRNDSIDDFIYNVSLSVFRPHRISTGTTDTTVTDLASGALLGAERSEARTEERRSGVALTTRLQWRLGTSGDSLVLSPTMFHSEGRIERRFTLAQSVPPAPALPLYDFGQGSTESRFTNLRVNGQWRQRLGSSGPRLELGGYVGRWSSASDTLRDEFRSGQAAPLRSTDDIARTRESSVNLTAKLSGLAGTQPGREHSLVGGAELEGVKRRETRTLTENGLPQLADFGDEFEATTLRTAAYLQDEWAVNPNWSLHAGLRWEGIRTQGDAGSAGDRPTKRSSVWTPLVHVLWKPDPKKRDQLRLSLTRSYRSPGTQALIARPGINGRFPASGPNDPTSPDSAGNPNLKPELATGLDLALERYLDGGGVLSANVFHRNISNLMRSVTTLETVSWSPVPRWVSRQQNIGDAVTQGIELEAKYRLDQLIAGAPRVEMRHNLALFRSRVDGVPGPDNRLDQQARGTANLGADYRLRGLPFTLGGNLNWVPGYRTQLAADRAVTVNTRRVWDGFVLWTVSPALGVRLLGSNLDPRDSLSTTEFDYAILPATALRRETAASNSPSYVNWQLRFEIRL